MKNFLNLITNISPKNAVSAGLALFVGAFAMGLTTFSNIDGSYLRASSFGNTHQVVLQTDLGEITIDLKGGAAPKAVENFVGLAKRGKFNQMNIHEVKSGIYIQTGDYQNGDGTGGESLWGEPFADEINSKLSHVRGVVAMANLGPDTNASQFFILLDDRPYLDGRHTIIGEVTKGLEVADIISEVEVDILNQPLNNIKVQTAFVR